MPYINRVLAGESFDFEGVLEYQKIGRRFMQAFYVPDVGPDGAVRGWLAAITDVTQRRQMEDALRISEEHFRMLADNIAQFAWILEANGKRWFNRRFVDFTGLTHEQLENGEALRLHHPDHAERVRQKFQEHQAKGLPWEDVFPLRGRDGEYRWFLSRAIPIRDATNQLVRWFGTNTDVTELRAAEEELRAAQEQLRAHAVDLERIVQDRTKLLREAIAQMEEFSYSVSHDLRAPLRAMNAYAEALIEDYGGKLDDTARNYLDRIRRSSQRMENLTHDVLTYSRVARAEVELSEVNLETVLRDLVAHYSELQPANADVAIETPLHRLRAHESSLGQCLGNLLTNAVKFVAPGTRPKIRVRSEALGERVRVWIEDNGIGIPPEYQAGLFRVFERVPTRHGYEGTGIGLAIVRKAMEKMGGRCGVESDGRNGSNFWIELPRA
jgi:PAS domain S-box-containing protein